MVISELLTIAVSKLEAKQGKQDSYAKDHFILQPHGLQERLLGDMPLKAVQLGQCNFVSRRANFAPTLRTLTLHGTSFRNCAQWMESCS